MNWRTSHWPLLTVAVVSCSPERIGSTHTAFESTPDWLLNVEAATLVGAGDIGVCYAQADEATAAILDAVPGIVFTTGDGAYPFGTTSDYANCYHGSWGRHKARTRPATGNHDYESPRAYGYFEYYGSAAGNPATGYYSYWIGKWHVIVLNTSIDFLAGSRQLAWLSDELARGKAFCTVAIFHNPRFSSGAMHGSDRRLEAMWRIMYAAGVDVALNGHEHNYERFAPQKPDGVRDDARGITQFVIGTGGGRLRPFGTPLANSIARISDTHGVLRLRLRDREFEWTFLPTIPSSSIDSGSAPCH